jgi:hypothetical protein
MPISSTEDMTNKTRFCLLPVDMKKLLVSAVRIV